MDADTPGAEEGVKKDRHGWNSYQNCREIHEARLAAHPFVDHSRPNTIAFEFYEFEGELYMELNGQIHCRNGVVLEVTKYFETRWTRGGRLQVRCFSYRYNASIAGKHNVLRYDNGHDLDEYHRHVFDVTNGQPVLEEHLTRNEFPLLSEVLDELARMFGEAA